MPAGDQVNQTRFSMIQPDACIFIHIASMFSIQSWTISRLGGYEESPCKGPGPCSAGDRRFSNFFVRFKRSSLIADRYNSMGLVEQTSCQIQSPCFFTMIGIAIIDGIEMYRQ
jgi:hypothetical protein